MNPIVDTVVGLIKPIGDIVDKFVTTDAEKAEAKRKLVEMQNGMLTQIIAYEQKQLTLQADIVKAEAQGHSWLQRNWRPITMLTFLVLVVCDSFGLLTFRLSQEAWALLKIGLGGYVIGRSAEKITPSIISGFNKK